MGSNTNDKAVSGPDEFHKHLDECQQCRNNPMGLCSTGKKKLVGVVGDVPVPSDISAK